MASQDSGPLTPTGHARRSPRNRTPPMRSLEEGYGDTRCIASADLTDRPSGGSSNPVDLLSPPTTSERLMGDMQGGAGEAAQEESSDEEKEEGRPRGASDESEEEEGEGEGAYRRGGILMFLDASYMRSSCFGPFAMMLQSKIR